MTPWWAILLVVVGTMIGAFGSLLLKKGAKNFRLDISLLVRNWRVSVGLMLYVIASVLYIIALKHGQLSVIYPIAAAQYVWICLLAQKYLNERMNKLKWIGVFIIITGIILINI